MQAPPALLKKLVIAPVAEARFMETLRLPGRVALDEHRLARIGPSISGRVTQIKAFIGQGVRKGETLALINSTELGGAQAAYLKAKTQVGLQRLAVDRARRLFGEGIISQATLKEREGALVEAEVELRADDDQLAVMGMSPQAIRRLAKTGHIDSVTPVTVTLNGTVIERHISVGQIAQPSDDLFTVADLSQVWVVAEAPERDAHRVSLDGLAAVEIPALPKRHITGKIIYVADTVDPSTRTVTVRMEVENKHREIKPEMLANMIIQQPSEAGLAIPAAAVVRVDERDHVFVRVAPDRFELRPVSLGPEQDGMRRVAGGLVLGQSVVVDGAFHLNNERIRKELE
ncbi:efflux RND transporter periplasmic adaptor subunit [Methylomagnum ishizawai]|uniref:efflux RND transporter periplasmic adaptor subunit n=1 Tax=Methylomagnum ishizawai TaxID=1760988 RepID=UPI0020CB62FB|nr:efflux RND transporter periplasmic adaptor subunit [Methylomagnum ishizawai]